MSTVAVFWDDLAFFKHPIVLYFGRVGEQLGIQSNYTYIAVQISFALYLVHGPILRSLTFAVLPRILQVTGGTETNISLFWTWILGAAVSFPAIVWAADVFWRCCSVKFAYALERKLLPVCKLNTEYIVR